MNAVIEADKGKKHSFKQKERLNHKEIQELFKRGKRIRAKDFLGLYLKNGENFAKLGVSLKKKLGNAVTRNYERRTVKEIFRTSKSIIPNVNLMIIKVTRSKLAFKDKETQVVNMLRKIQV